MAKLTTEMTPEESREFWTKQTEISFAGMRGMLKQIEANIKDKDPELQWEFAKCLGTFVVEALRDSQNPLDQFLNPELAN